MCFVVGQREVVLKLKEQEMLPVGIERATMFLEVGATIELQKGRLLFVVAGSGAEVVQVEEAELKDLPRS